MVLLIHSLKLSAADHKGLSLRTERFEKRKIGARHPRLRAERQDFPGECRTARGVQMRGDLVEKENRGPTDMGTLPRLRKDDGNQ